MSPEGAEWRTPTGTTPDASTDNINESEKGEKSLLCMGNPSLQGGGVYLRMGEGDGNLVSFGK